MTDTLTYAFLSPALIGAVLMLAWPFVRSKAPQRPHRPTEPRRRPQGISQRVSATVAVLAATVATLVLYRLVDDPAPADVFGMTLVPLAIGGIAFFVLDTASEIAAGPPLWEWEE